jgi:hypothetical protein
MRFSFSIKKCWSSIRWKMLIIFAFSSISSTILVARFSITVLNVVIRRERAYLIEERINGVVDCLKRMAAASVDGVPGCAASSSNSPLLAEYARAVWPESQSTVAVLPKGNRDVTGPAWLKTSSFGGIVVDRGALEIRSFRRVERPGCSVTML